MGLRSLLVLETPPSSNFESQLGVFNRKWIQILKRAKGIVCGRVDFGELRLKSKSDVFIIHNVRELNLNDMYIGQGAAEPCCLY